ncbi:peptidoglycan-binding domain-containing protein [Brasilonema sennae]|nr:peptidoglycan-binding domain-containing protein [Brasilonema sennae]
MTDIALLMTSVLTTGQLSPTIAPELRLVQRDNNKEKLTQRQLSQIVSAAQITPPEFVQPDMAAQAATSIISIENKSILHPVEINIGYKGSPNIARAKNFQVAAKDTTEDIIINTQCFHLCAEPEILLPFDAIPQFVAEWEHTVRNFKKSPLKESQKIMLASTYFFGLQVASESSAKTVIGQRKQIVPQIDTSQSLPILRFSSSGVAVKVLQQLLSSNGYSIRSDGVFGALTEAAVKAFQNKRNLAVDGIVGQRTWYELTK